MTATTSPTWPDVVWNAALLRPLDARSRGEIAAAGRLRRVVAGEIVHRAGDPADALYVVVRGECELDGRRIGAGDIFGEEATIASFAVRPSTARAITDSVLAEVPLVVFRRAAARSGGTELLSRTERALRRAATLELLRTTRSTRDLPRATIESLLDAARHVQLARGEMLTLGEEVFLVADGLVADRFVRGDVVREAAAASGPSWGVAFPRGLFPGPAAPRRLPVVPFADPYRLQVARSLLLIDQESCIRCGHCAWSCADTHDGTSRLVRHGETIAVLGGTQLVPNSCQHCKSPSCMIDCPTGAIRRDARGQVEIREDLCTGCGSCAKACPWDNIQLAPRQNAGPSLSALIAVKCDLCGGAEPACVSACPTEAAVRIEPALALGALGGREEKPPRTAAWPWMIGGALAAIGIARAPLGPWTSGVASGAAIVLLAGYVVGKRRRWIPARVGYIGHMALGVLAAGLVGAHAHRLAASGGALAIAFGLAVLSGLLGALISATVPRALVRVERTVRLPEDLAQRPRAIDEAIFAALSGKSAAVKTLYAERLGPYRQAPLGPILLFLSRRSLAEEEARLHGTAEAEALVRLVVEHRAVRLQRLLTLVLRGWLVPHVALTAVALVLLVVHVIAVTRR